MLIYKYANLFDNNKTVLNNEVDTLIRDNTNVLSLSFH